MRALAPSLSDYRRAELRRAPLRVGVYAWLAGALLIALCQLLFPSLPAQAIDLLRLAFHLEDLGGVVLFNDYLAVYLCASFVGIFGLLGVVVGPREERQLELLLSKPLPAAELVAARTWPVLAVAALVGVGLALACAAAALPYVGGSVSLAGAFGAGLAMTALALLGLTALSVLFIRITETMSAVLIALVVALLPMIPASVFLYRPDLFADRPGLAAATVLANLVWYDQALAWIGPLALLLALLLALFGVRLGGALLARSA